jgi:hypothetical protein
MSPPRALLPLLGLAALAGCGDPLLFAEVESRRVCVARLRASIPGSPAAAGEVTWSGEVDLGDGVAELRDAATGEVRLLGVSVRNASADLGGISAIDVAVAHGEAVPTPALTYAVPANAPSPLTQLSAGGGDLDVFSYLEGGVLRFSVRFSGAPPGTGWTADVEVCASAKVLVDALEVAR